MNTGPTTGSPLPDPSRLPFAAPCRQIGVLTPFEWVRFGWQDLRAAPRHSLFYGVLFASFGALLAVMTWRLGLLPLYIGLASGFVFVGPFLAMGLYSISYQLENGRKPTLLFSIQEGRAHLRETLVLGLCLLVILLVWGRAAMMISVFLPSDSGFTWRDLIPYWIIGSLAGAIFSVIVFAATAFSLPMLLDRRADAITAVVTSINATLRNKPAMLVWGTIIATSILIGFATMFLGFIILMPLLGYSTWHAYRRTIDATLWPATHP